MSMLVKIRDVTIEERKNFLTSMIHKYKDKITKRYETIRFPIAVYGEYMTVPLGYVSESLSRFVNKPVPKNPIPNTINLRHTQRILFDRVLSNKSQSIGIEVKPGFGKTVLALAISSVFEHDVFIFVHRKILLNQWNDEINKFLPGNNRVNVLMINKLEDSPVNNCIIIIDEAHLCLTKKIYPVLAKKLPSLMIGLSATFYKNSEEQIFLNWFFPVIERLPSVEGILLNKVEVCVTQTHIKPDIIDNSMGKVDWSHALKSLAFNTDRNKIIIEKIVENSEKHILVLVKFIEHAEILTNLIRSALPNKSCCVCYGDKEIDKNSQIFISTFNKMGTGISLNKLNCLVIAIDIKNYAVQYFGRVMREHDRDAHIIDFLDDNTIFKKHFNERLKIYRDMNAVIKMQ